MCALRVATVCLAVDLKTRISEGTVSMKRLNTRRANVGKALLLALLAATMPGAAWAQKFTLKQALDYPLPYGLTTTTHGDRIAWVFNLRGARNVWVADGAGFSARQLTH